MQGKPICIDLYCGLGGWSEGFLSEGYECHGYDIEAHDYGTGGYPGTLHLRDILTIHGSEFKDATIIVGSSPCQKYSYMAMPWTKAKDMGRFYGDAEHPERIGELNALFDAQFRIQREASEAAGRWIPMIVENVRGAQKWVGKAAANYGSFYLWGDVGMVGNRVVCVVDGRITGGAGVMPIKASKVPSFRFDGNGGSFQTASVEATKAAGSGWNKNGTLKSNNRMVPDGTKVGGTALNKVGFNVAAVRKMLHGDPNVTNAEGRKVVGQANRRNGHSHTRHLTNQLEHDEANGIKQGGDWFGKNCGTSMSRLYGSKSTQRKMASAMIAKIPFPLSQHIARTFKPQESK